MILARQRWASRLAALLTCTLMCTLVGCSDPPANEPTSASTPVVADQPEATPQSAANASPFEEVLEQTWTGDLDVIEQHRVIRVLTVYGLGRFYLDRGQPRGLTVASARRFVKYLNELRKRGHVSIHAVTIPVARDQLIPALMAGRGDLIIAGMTSTAERELLVDFSIPSSKPFDQVLVTGPSAPEIGSIEGLAGQTIYVRHSSSYRENLELLSQRFASEGRPPIIIEAVSEYLEDDDLIEMVNDGLLPWTVVDEYKMLLWNGVFNRIMVRDDIVLGADTRTRWVFRKNSPLLADVVNGFLLKNREGTLVGNVLRNRYIREFKKPSSALDTADLKRFRQLEEIFRKYGNQYQVDHLLAAAQGFQESRLDQTARSASGAIGVMQLLPSTASDPNVAIPNIQHVDDNIHAGIKYLDFLRSRYFSGPDIDNWNSTILALAAYNVGPGRMVQLRAKAAQKGYDPNIWFDNVEMVAASDVGAEPVQYVANIFKSYVAYHYSAELLAKRDTARASAGIEAE